MAPAENRLPSGSDVVAVTKKASELRDAAIAQLLAQREQIDRDLKTLGYIAVTPNGHIRAKAANGGRAAQVHLAALPEGRNKFRGLTLATIGKMLLANGGTLHGKEIERLARAGGYKGGIDNFQNYMPMAFKRDGGFENIGGNNWKLKDEAAQEK
jgi:hypothetical protein